MLLRLQIASNKVVKFVLNVLLNLFPNRKDTTAKPVVLIFGIDDLVVIVGRDEVANVIECLVDVRLSFPNLSIASLDVPLPLRVGQHATRGYAGGARWFFALVGPNCCIATAFATGVVEERQQRAIFLGQKLVELVELLLVVVEDKEGFVVFRLPDHPDKVALLSIAIKDNARNFDLTKISWSCDKLRAIFLPHSHGWCKADIAVGLPVSALAIGTAVNRRHAPVTLMGSSLITHIAVHGRLFSQRRRPVFTQINKPAEWLD